MDQSCLESVAQAGVIVWGTFACTHFLMALSNRITQSNKTIQTGPQTTLSYKQTQLYTLEHRREKKGV